MYAGQTDSRGAPQPACGGAGSLLLVEGAWDACLGRASPGTPGARGAAQLQPFLFSANACLLPKRQDSLRRCDLRARSYKNNVRLARNPLSQHSAG